MLERVASGLWRVLARVREFHADQVELHERLLLLNRPWEEALLHWCGDGDDAELHGHLAPPADGRRHSVTNRGWCPCHRAGSLR